jgi:lysozyme
MNVSQNGLAKIKQWEALRLKAYQDEAGVWTIGYGSTRNVTPGLQITASEAEARLAADVAEAAGAVERAVKVPLTQPQFDSLASFVFNVGSGAFSKSTALKRLNSGDYAGAVEAMQWFNKVTKNGQLVTSAGLVNRRQAEAQLFGPLSQAAEAIVADAANGIKGWIESDELIFGAVAVVGLAAAWFMFGSDD